MPNDAALPLLTAGSPIDLDNCAREPIHIPGSIQPRGVLLAVEEQSRIIVQASANLFDQIGVDAREALGTELVNVIGTAADGSVTRALGYFGDLRERNPVEVVIMVDGAPVDFDAILHRTANGVLLLELEQAKGDRPFTFPNTYLAVRGTVAELNRAATLEELYEITAREVRELTGFDRVMVYRYDDEFNGEVVAEDKRADLESFLGLHYPASDIPAQARALYEKNWIRLISDVNYEPALLERNLAADDFQPLDLTFATLRSVSPIHIEYLRNMGVRASMSISLLRHGALWGLIACHHYSGPHTPPYGVRTAAEFLGSTLSLRLVDRADETDLRVLVESQSVLAKLSVVIRDESKPLPSALLGSPGLLDLLPADGVAVAFAGRTATIGIVPDEGTVDAIVRWDRSSGEDEVSVTDSLAVELPELDVAPRVAAGVLAIPLPADQYIVWFRVEAVQSVDWSGDPNHKAHEAENESVRLSPRKSFDRWREVVRLRSTPWPATQVESASAIRSLAVESLYVRAGRELQLTESLQRSLLPSSLPSIPDWTITAHYEPAQGRIGGDWYDAVMLPDDIVVLVLGDVAGHGLVAAGTMAELRNALRAHLVTTNSPAKALSALREFADTLLPTVFATVFVAAVNIRTGQVRAVSAGHLTPYLVSSGAPTTPMVRTCPPIGVSGVECETAEFVIPDGSGLVLFSDGLVERRDEIISTGLDRLTSALAVLGPEASATDIATTVGTLGNRDDATVLTIHRRISDDRVRDADGAVLRSV
jgi:chemotaxis family two-component system sensor kinase Cph1